MGGLPVLVLVKLACRLLRLALVGFISPRLLNLSFGNAVNTSSPFIELYDRITHENSIARKHQYNHYGLLPAFLFYIQVHESIKRMWKNFSAWQRCSEGTESGNRDSTCDGGRMSGKENKRVKADMADYMLSEWRSYNDSKTPMRLDYRPLVIPLSNQADQRQPSSHPLNERAYACSGQLISCSKNPLVAEKDGPSGSASPAALSTRVSDRADPFDFYSIDH